MNSIEKTHPDVIHPLGELAKLVASSGVKEAGELFEQVTAEIAKSNPRKSVLKSCWDNLLVVLPVIKDSTAIYKTINDFLIGGK